MIGRDIIRCQQFTDFIGRRQITDIVHQELTQSLQDQRVRQSIFLHKISGHNRFINFFNIIYSIFFRVISIRSSQTAFCRILFKQLFFVHNSIKILTIFSKAKWKYMYFNISSSKKSCQIRTKQKSIRPRNINIILFFRIQTVYRQFKLRTHLNFIHKKIICFSLLKMLFYIRMKGMILLHAFIIQIHKINEYNIDIFTIAFQILNICLHQF